MQVPIRGGVAVGTEEKGGSCGHRSTSTWRCGRDVDMGVGVGVPAEAEAEAAAGVDAEGDVHADADAGAELEGEEGAVTVTLGRLRPQPPLAGSALCSSP